MSLDGAQGFTFATDERRSLKRAGMPTAAIDELEQQISVIVRAEKLWPKKPPTNSRRAAARMKTADAARRLLCDIETHERDYSMDIDIIMGSEENVDRVLALLKTFEAASRASAAIRSVGISPAAKASTVVRWVMAILEWHEVPFQDNEKGADFLAIQLALRNTGFIGRRSSNQAALDMATRRHIAAVKKERSQRLREIQQHM